MRSSPIQVGSGFYRTLALGNNSTMAIDPYGTLTAWGENLYGQAGTNSITSYSWTQLSNGDAHSLALRSDGRLFAWGLNTSGQLGTSDTVARQSPTQINANIGGVITSNWSQVSAGASHTVAIANDGVAYGWGLNTSGQVGDITIVNRSAPVQIGIAGAGLNYSVLFNGTSQYLSIASNAAFALGTGAFTVEGWIFVGGTPGQYTIFGLLGGLKLTVVPAGFRIWANDGSLYTNADTTINQSKWYHFALVRESTSLGKLYLNGVLIFTDNGSGGGSPTSSAWITSNFSANDFYVGYYGGGFTNYFNGYISNLRLIKGTALYTSAFTPSVSPFSNIANTSLLTCNAPTIIDGSSNALAITNNGTATVTSSANPFIYYSGSFNGTNQSIEVANSSNILDFSSGNFTVEAWIYATSYSTASKWAFEYANYGGGVYFALSTFNGIVRLVTNWGVTGNDYTAGPTLVAETWYHVAIVRASNTVTFYVNGTSYATVDATGISFDNVDGIRIGSGDSVGSTWVPNYWWPGYVSNFRAVKGVAVYTGNFTTPTNILRTIQSAGTNITALTGTETVLLTCQDSSFIDKSVNAFTITNTNGSVVSSTIAPFNAFATVGGTGYLVASKIAAGNNYTLAIKSDNTLHSWGLNTSYQLGNGSTTSRSSPTQIGTSSWSQISAGNAHAIALDVNNLMYTWGLNSNGQAAVTTRPGWLMVTGSMSIQVMNAGIRSDNSLYAWGSNTAGGLGTGDLISRSSPVQIGTDYKFVDVGAATFASLFAIKNDGSAWATGSNTTGYLGIGNTIDRSSLSLISGGISWTVISGGNGVAAGIDTSGRLYTWSGGSGGQLGDGFTTNNRSTPTQIAVDKTWSTVSMGTGFGLAITTIGTLWAWGTPLQGSLGDGTTIARSSPVQVAGSWSSVYAAPSHVVGIKSDGTLWGWGLNNTGQLGLGDTAPRSSPTQIGVGFTYNSVSVDSSHSVFKRTDNTIWATGNNGQGQLGNGEASTNHRSTPVQILAADENWNIFPKTALATSMAIRASDNTLWVWGADSAGQLGVNAGIVTYRSPIPQVNGPETNIISPILIGTSSWSQISAGYSHSLAITSDNKLFGWGNNSNGQLGIDGTFSFTSIAAGLSKASVIRNDNSLWVWGLGTSGQLGDSTTTTKSSPVIMVTKNYWKTVTRSTLSDYALTVDNKLFAWGENSIGSLGDGTTISKSSPVQIGTSSWIMVATGGLSTAGTQAVYAIRSDGGLFAWGANLYGQLGQNNAITRSSPVQIGTSSWSVVSAGGQFAMAITNDGKLFSWGRNDIGQLGKLDIVSRSSPVQIGTSSWSTVSAGGSHIVAIKLDNTVFSWGLNTQGQLGDATTVSRSSPVQVGTVSSSLTNASAYSVQLNGTSQYITTSAQTSSTYFGTGDFTIETWVNLTSTPTKVGSGTYSLSFNGTSQSLTTSTLNSSQYVGTGDFTIECWVYLNSTPALNAGLVCGGTFSASDWQISWSGTGFCFMPDGSTRKVNTSNIAAMSNNTWYHVAFTRASGMLYSFLNGTIIATGVTETSNFTGTSGMLIGVNRGGTVYLPGYISNLRVIKGQAIYSGNFTPATSPLTPNTIAHTGAGAAGSLTGTVVLLTGQSDTVVDNSASAFTFTNAGSVATSTTAPTTIYDYASVISVNNNWQWGWNDSGSFGFNFMPAAGKTTDVNTGVLTLNTWYHIAVQRISGTISAWVNGVNTGTNFSDTTNYTSTNAIYIGRNRHTTAIAYFPGYISNLRITKGQGLFTGTFTPSINPLTNSTVGHTGSGAASSLTGTVVLLTLQNQSTITDNSATGFTFTPTNSPTVGSLSTPFTNAVAGGAVFATQVSAGYTHTVIIDTANKIFAWGLNSSGQLGLNDLVNRSAPVQIGLKQNWISASAGSEQSIAQDATGTIWAWGLGTTGQLGDNTAVTKNSPVLIGSISLSSVSSPTQVGTSSYILVNAGNNISTAISSDNKLFVWGLGTTGQLGTGITFSRSSPVQISTNSYNLVNAGGTHTTFVTNYSPQLILSTGLNTSGQLGQSSIISRSSPTQVAASTSKFNSPVTVSVGDYSSYYVSSPTQVGTSSWTSVSAGGTHTLGVKYDNTLYAWGYNANGQLGGSSTINRSSPVQIGTSSWSQISAGDSHNTIAKSDGTINTFGLNTFGQLGDGT